MRRERKEREVETVHVPHQLCNGRGAEKAHINHTILFEFSNLPRLSLWMDTQPRVNSKYLSHFIGRHVLLMSEIPDAFSSRSTMVRASDGGEVVVHLPPGESFET
jgi:hypothetical protein